MTCDFSLPTVADKFNRVDSHFLKFQRQAAEDRLGIPSMIVAIIHDQDIAWMKSYGYADLVAKSPLTPETIYSIGSITKIFTATMLMQLRDAGLLQLDDPVEKYLPGFKFAASGGNASLITLRHLVTHTSGLPLLPSGFPHIFAKIEAIRRGEEAFPSIQELLASLEKASLADQPLNRFAYSNVGFAVLGHVLERIARQPYKKYVIEHILRPLHMDRTGFDLTDEFRAQMATGYSSYRNSEDFQVAPIPDMRALVPVGQMYCCAADMARFLVWQFRDTPAADEQILSRKTIQEMQTPVCVASSQDTPHTAIGWLLDNIGEHRVLYHNGTTYGFGATVALVPNAKLGILILMNRPITAEQLDLVNPALQALEILLPAWE